MNIGNAVNSIVAHWKLIVVVIAAGVGVWLLWGFPLNFLLLTCAYGAIAYVAINFIAQKNGVDPAQYWRDNNTYFWIGMGAVAITFAIALFNWGPATLLPERYPTPEQRAMGGNFLEHVLHGRNAKEVPVPKEPLPWAQGTWFWWKALPIYFLLWFVYSFYAWYDEIVAAYAERKAYAEARKAAPPGTPPPPPHRDPSFSARFIVALLADLVAEVIAKLSTKYARS